MHPLGGVWTSDVGTFCENVCKNERIGSHRGASQFTFGSLPLPSEPISCSSKFFEIESGRPFFYGLP